MFKFSQTAWKVMYAADAIKSLNSRFRRLNRSRTVFPNAPALILPALTLGANQAGSLTRITRSSMLDVIRQDYLRTARAKGVSEKQVIRKHALKNALIPIITVFGSTLGGAFGGAIMIETVFSWPGVGRLTVRAINDRDMTLATGCIIMFTMFMTLTILLVDIAYAFVDPRIKARYSK